MKQLLCIAILAFLLGGVPPGATAGSISEYRVKAAYLYNFAKFIHWPDEASAATDAPLVIGVLGKNPFHGELAPLEKRKIRNRPIVVQQLSSIVAADSCHLLYVNLPPGLELQRTLASLRSLPVVTIGDSSNFAAQGGVVQFVPKRDRLRFIVNLQVAKNTGISIDSQLLSLAAKVLGDGK